MSVVQLDHPQPKQQPLGDSSESRQRELVVLIHGLAASQTMLKPLEKRIRQRGFETRNWGYRSITGDTFPAGRCRTSGEFPARGAI